LTATALGLLLLLLEFCFLLLAESFGFPLLGCLQRSGSLGISVLLTFLLCCCFGVLLLAVSCRRLVFFLFLFGCVLFVLFLLSCFLCRCSVVTHAFTRSGDTTHLQPAAKHRPLAGLSSPSPLSQDRPSMCWSHGLTYSASVCSTVSSGRGCWGCRCSTTHVRIFVTGQQDQFQFAWVHPDPFDDECPQ